MAAWWRASRRLAAVASPGNHALAESSPSPQSFRASRSAPAAQQRCRMLQAANRHKAPKLRLGSARAEADPNIRVAGRALARSRHESARGLMLPRPAQLLWATGEAIWRPCE